MSKNTDYNALVQKIDDKATEITAKHSPQINCKKGCHSCCLPNISVSKVEAVRIQDFLFDNPDILVQARHLQQENPHRGTRCSFLDKEGGCLIYEARPIICRTHGLPIRLREDDKTVESWCPLNFQEGVQKIDQLSWMNLDIVNSILALINSQAYPSVSERIILKPESFEERLD